jgi:hypothetical protein
MRPGDVGEAEIRPLLQAEVGIEGVVDALFVAFCFNLIGRVADALGFEVVTPPNGSTVGLTTCSNAATSERRRSRPPQASVDAAGSSACTTSQGITA